jgi:hypothetical protein
METKRYRAFKTAGQSLAALNRAMLKGEIPSDNAEHKRLTDEHIAYVGSFEYALLLCYEQIQRGNPWGVMTTLGWHIEQRFIALCDAVRK